MIGQKVVVARRAVHSAQHMRLRSVASDGRYIMYALVLHHSTRLTVIAMHRALARQLARQLVSQCRSPPMAPLLHPREASGHLNSSAVYLRHCTTGRVRYRAGSLRAKKDDWGDWTFDASAFAAGTGTSHHDT
jgi:hypothetical protein